MTSSFPPEQAVTSKFAEFSHSIDEILDLVNELRFKSKGRDRLIRDIEKTIKIEQENQNPSLIDFDLEKAIGQIKSSRGYELPDSELIEEIEKYLSHKEVSLVEELQDIKYLIERYQENQELAQKIKSFLLLLKNISDNASEYVTKVTSMEEELKNNTETLKQLGQRVENFSTLISGFQTQLQGNEDRIANQVVGRLTQNLSTLEGRLGTIEGRIPQDFATALQTNITNGVRASLPPNLVGRREFWGGIISTFGALGFLWFMFDSSLNRIQTSQIEVINARTSSLEKVLNEKTSSTEKLFNEKYNSLEKVINQRFDSLEK